MLIFLTGWEFLLEMFELASAMQFIYKIGYQIRKEHIVELNVEQYASLVAQRMDGGKRWYQITRGPFEPAGNELQIVDRPGVVMLMKAIIMVLKTSEESGQTFDTFRERLDYCKQVWPTAITEPEPEPKEGETKRSFKVITGGL